MTPPNATSQAVQDMISELSLPNADLSAIGNKYQTMENALHLILSTVGTYKGNDPLTIRILDIAKQASDFDPLFNS